MIEPVTKLIQITVPTPQEQSLLRLDTADGRFNLADRLQKDIDEWCMQAFDDGPRTHLGASIIGGECDRHSWYVFRWMKHKIFSGRMQRLFQDGHWYEERYIQMLEAIGCTVSQVSESGEQHRIFAVQGHFGGSLDGMVALPERYGPAVQYDFLSEFKTSNDKHFNEMNHVKEDKPQHWGQMCVYAVQKQIRYGIYFLVNKNDGDMKIHVVELDWTLGQHLIDKGEHIIRSLQPPPRISKNPSHWVCKMCDHHGICMMGQPADVNCRTCQHSEPIDEKQWFCRQWSATIPDKAAMIAGCHAHRMIETD